MTLQMHQHLYYAQGPTGRLALDLELRSNSVWKTKEILYTVNLGKESLLLKFVLNRSRILISTEKCIKCILFI